MFAVDSFIDTVQGAKKYFVNTFVTDKEMQKPLNAFVDTQTEFVKQIVKTNQALAEQSLATFEKFAKSAKAIVDKLGT
jgi:uncharacterized protein (UPF0332 family)